MLVRVQDQATEVRIHHLRKGGRKGEERMREDREEGEKRKGKSARRGGGKRKKAANHF